MDQAQTTSHAAARPERLPEPPEVHEDHGSSVAAWVGVALMILGSIAITVGIVLPSQISLWVGIALAVIGAVAWPLGVRMGYGSKHGQ